MVWQLDLLVDPKAILLGLVQASCNTGAGSRFTFSGELDRVVTRSTGPKTDIKLISSDVAPNAFLSATYLPLQNKIVDCEALQQCMLLLRFLVILHFISSCLEQYGGRQDVVAAAEAKLFSVPGSRKAFGRAEFN
jgi:hypothetical protein